MFKNQPIKLYNNHYEHWQLPTPEPETLAQLEKLAAGRHKPLFNRQDLETLASGKISSLLGPLFKQQDDYIWQVRMPQPPLLMVDRIISMTGEAGSMSPCSLWSETDIKADAWYMRDGHMSPGMMIEAGQADLLLVSWVGIDFHNKGERIYRVLGADATVHGDLAKVGETLSFEIYLDGLSQLGDIRLMFFHYNCYINGQRRITVRNAQAGFFTPAELDNSIGVLWNPAEAKPRPDARMDDFPCLTQYRNFSHEQVQAFANGDTYACFGAGFERARQQSYSPRIPNNQAGLIYDIPIFDPQGGPKGRGYLLARQKVSPDDWFFKAHFKNDPCMPGTLMADVGFHALNFYLAALGFTLDKDGWRFVIIPEVEMQLRCRGQCTPRNKEVTYEIFVEEVIAGANPSIIVDLLISVDGLKAVHAHSFSARLVPGDQELLKQQAADYIGSLPALTPESLGNRDFLTTHQLRYPYIVGEMANGIASADCVIAAARAGFLGSFGAGGLMPAAIEKNLLTIYQALGRWSGWGANLIHSPQEPALEQTIVDLFLRLGLRHVSASAYMALSPAIVHYAYSGLHRDSLGNIQRPNHVLAKISRPEVAQQFMLPAPLAMLQTLVDQGKLTAEEALLGQSLPVAEDITAEGDSGGHTDRRSLTVLFPLIQDLARRISQQQNYQQALRVGAAGGIGTPAAAAAAFAMGAAYIVTGSINQSAVEAGISDQAKVLLAQCDMTDVEMAPAADMFELGVKLQVLKRGTLFSRRASKLYELYSKYPSLEALPPAEQEALEKTIFLEPLAAVWERTKSFFTTRDPQQLIRAEQDPKHRMALVFRSYLGLSSRWAINGDPARRLDYQIWCGPAMGGFNAWVKDSYLEDLANRSIEQIGLNLLEGAAVIARAQQLRCLGTDVPAQAFEFRPRLIVG